MKNNELSSKIEIVSIDDKFSIHFISIPEGYMVTNLNLELHKTWLIGRLNQFNRVKLLKPWRKGNKDLVAFFTDILQKRDWDFIKFPNPIAFASYYVGNSN